ncbi:acyltransferase [Robertmurraya beringensis]|uniref:Acyltransferase n=1 Tax=Robertmurraya beringensis TaxID=641660 RepID=A0ABV6KQY2_9BACI
MKQFIWSLFINSISSSSIIHNKIRVLIYRLFGISIINSQIYSGQFICRSNLKIGNGSFINHNCFFENTMAPIEIGNNCSIAMEVMFCTATHDSGHASKRAGRPIGKPIKVGDGCWIGARATILPGVTIGSGCVIAAGSVVNKDCEPNGIYAGVPAKRIKNL